MIKQILKGLFIFLILAAGVAAIGGILFMASKSGHRTEELWGINAAGLGIAMVANW